MPTVSLTSNSSDSPCSSEISNSLLANGAAESRPPGKQESVITVPKSAVRHAGDEAYVWTVRDGIVRRVSVVYGLTTETGIEVKQGLKDGDSVVITPDVKLKVSVR